MNQYELGTLVGKYFLLIIAFLIGFIIFSKHIYREWKKNKKIDEEEGY
jgi:uncharacterized protein YneF (UPF0154 family)